MAKEKSVYYLIPRPGLDDLRSAAVLDMLRYDYARVESNAPPGFYLLSNSNGPQVERWASFGVRGILGPFRDVYAAVDAGRNARKGE